MYAKNDGAAKYVKQKLIKLKGEKEKSKFGWRLQYSFFYQLTENKQRYRRIQQPINQ